MKQLWIGWAQADITAIQPGADDWGRCTIEYRSMCETLSQLPRWHLRTAKRRPVLVSMDMTEFSHTYY